MSCESFCTCVLTDCPAFHEKHGNTCNACIKKNLDSHEIPACFWSNVEKPEVVKSDYTFLKFAESILKHEKSA